MENKSGIYIIESPSGGCYIGSAMDMEQRRRLHRNMLRRGDHHSRALQRAWWKYGEDSMRWRPLLICSIENLIFYEQRAIDRIRPRYNMAPTAGSSLGIKRSAETRKNVSLAQIGKKRGPRTAEQKARMSAACRLRAPPSKETRAKISATLTGRRNAPHSDATKRKIALAHLGSKRTAAQCAAMSAAHLGKKLSQAHRDKVVAVLDRNRANRERELRGFAFDY